MSVGQMHILGIDVDKLKLDVALLLPDGKFKSEVVANTLAGFEKLAAWLERNSAAQVHACMEVAGIYWKSAAVFLAEQGHTVSVVNPAQMLRRPALSRTKTDRKDARLIARFCAERRPPLWEPPPPEISELRALVTRSRCDALERMRTQEKNRLHVS